MGSDTATRGMTPVQRLMVQLCGVRPPEMLGEQLVRDTEKGVLDWGGLVACADHHRTIPFLHVAVGKLGIGDRLPDQITAFLRQHFLRNFQRNQAFEEEVKMLLAAANDAGTPMIPLRGAVMSEVVFGNPAIRSFGDIDVLVRLEDLPRVKEAVHALGYGRDPRFLDDPYYERHHLHLPYIKPENYVLLEIHWSYDHKYTPFNVDMDATFRNAVPLDYHGVPCLHLSHEDLLIMLALHAFKHTCSVKYTNSKPEAPGLVLAEQGFLQFLDLHYGVEYCRDTIDWERFRRRVRDWNLEVPVYSTLRVMEAFFRDNPGSEVPEVPGQPSVRRFERMVFTTLSALMPKAVISGPTAAGAPAGGSRMARFGLYHLVNRVTKVFFFNTARLFDIVSYIFPSPAFLHGRYGRRSALRLPLLYLRHLLVFAGQATWNLSDMVWFFVQKKIRPPAPLDLPTLPSR